MGLAAYRGEIPRTGSAGLIGGEIPRTGLAGLLGNGFRERVSTIGEGELNFRFPPCYRFLCIDIAVEMMARTSAAIASTRRIARAQLNPVTVTQSNELIQATYSLTLNEKRLLLMAASHLDPRKPAKRTEPIKIAAKDFASMFDITSAGHTYEALDDAAKRLYERSIRSVERNKRGDPIRMRRWLRERALYDDGAVTLWFNEDVLPYMTLLSEQFTTYQLRQVGALSSFYTIRIYELCAQYKKLGERYIALEMLREILDVGGKYPNVKDLRRCLLEPAEREINETTDLQIHVTPKRDGRKVIGFLFKITMDDQHKLPL